MKTITKGTSLTTYFDSTGVDTNEYLAKPSTGTWVALTLDKYDQDVDLIYSTNSNGQFITSRRPSGIKH